MTKEGVPEISFCREDLVTLFGEVSFFEEDFPSDTFYGSEHMFYLDKRPGESPANSL
jgi:hypothetical protein